MINTKLPTNTNPNRANRLINNNTIETLINHISPIDWSNVTNLEDPHNAFSKFNNILLQEIDKAMPLKICKNTNKTFKPWITKELKQKINTKN